MSHPVRAGSVFFASSQRGLPGPRYFHNANLAQKFNDRGNLAIVSRDFKRIKLRADIHDLGSKDVHDAQDFSPRLFFGAHLDEGHFTVNELGFREIKDLESIYQLIDLFYDLRQNAPVSAGHQSDACYTGFIGFSRSDIFYIEPSAAQESDHPCKNSGAVLHQYTYRMPLLVVFHLFSRAHTSNISEMLFPAGTMG